MRLALACLLTLLISACATTGGTTTASTPAASAESTAAAPASNSAASSAKEATPPSASAVAIQRIIPYAENNRIAANIRTECQLDVQLSDFIVEAAQEHGVPVVQKPKVSSQDPGRVLVLEIVDAVSQGNAFIGHRKYTQIRGTYYENGTLTGSFVAARNSMGGAFAGYKSSCSVLGRTVKTLGQDVVRFLALPIMDARLGDM